MKGLPGGESQERLIALPLEELMRRARCVKLTRRGDRFSLCTIMNVRSGGCTEDCAFCAQSARYQTGAPVHPVKPLEEILEAAARAREAGAERFSLVASGRGPVHGDIEPLARAVEEIRRHIGISVCASLGITDRSTLSRLREAGLGRYHHNIETSARYFPKVVGTHGFGERIATIKAAREAGLEVCAGGIIGMGETMADRLDMAATLARLDVDSVPLNILCPIQGTPLEGTRPLSVVEILRSIAMFRLALPAKSLRIAGGRERALGDFQGMAFWAGADAMLIGGYLTVRGRPVETDQRLVKEMQELWREGLRSEVGKRHGDDLRSHGAGNHGSASGRMP